LVLILETTFTIKSPIKIKCHPSLYSFRMAHDTFVIVRKILYDHIIVTINNDAMTFN